MTGFSGDSDGKESACNAAAKLSCRRKWQPTPLFLPEKSHGQRSLVGYGPKSRKRSDRTEQLSTHPPRRLTPEAAAGGRQETGQRRGGHCKAKIPPAGQRPFHPEATPSTGLTPPDTPCLEPDRVGSRIAARCPRRITITPAENRTHF